MFRGNPSFVSERPVVEANDSGSTLRRYSAEEVEPSYPIVDGLGKFVSMLDSTEDVTDEMSEWRPVDMEAAGLLVPGSMASGHVETPKLVRDTQYDDRQCSDVDSALGSSLNSRQDRNLVDDFRRDDLYKQPEFVRVETKEKASKDKVG